MKTLTLQNILDQKKLPLHIIIVIVALTIAALLAAGRTESKFPDDLLHPFLLLVIQLELFIYLGTRMFNGLKPRYTRKELTKTVLSRFSLFIVLCFIINLIVSVIFIYVINVIHNNKPVDAIANFMQYGFGGWLKGTLGGLLFGAALFIYIQWQDALNREQKLREENLIFQNETLKNQINPHFLFNSLNTLSSLVNTQPEIAEKFINRLSSIYRYIIEKTSMDRVSLEAELSFIRDYFYLHKIRGDEKIQLEIKIDNPAGFEILPISLQGLVENAIKHNKATRKDPLKIIIYIEGQHIIVKNNLQKMATQIRSTGTGLKNLAERVKLVSGRDLIIEESVNNFLVKLPLLS
jgi:sensor histidine kinase YesM